jgi:transcriptional regulator GlxA family with amidase domain
MTSKIFLCRGVVRAEIASSQTEWFDMPATARRAGYHVECLAGSLGIGPRRLNVLFVRDMGIPTKRWLRELRFVDGVHYWLEKRNPDQVAEMLGFGHRREWYREIRHFAGMRWQDFLAQLAEHTAA